MHFFALSNPFTLENVQYWFEWGGYFILFGLLFACGLGLPLPEDIPLLLGGYFVALGQMHLLFVAILAWLGIIGGDCCLYWLSRRYGMNITKVRFIGSHVTESRILWAGEKFDQYGVWVVAVCRLFAGVRGAMVIAAGVVRFNFVKFLIADGIAALFSGGLFVAIGYYAGRKLGSLSEMRQKIQHYEHYVVIGLIGAAVLFGVYLWWRHKRNTTLSEKTFEKIVDPAMDRLTQRREKEGGTPKDPAGGRDGESRREGRVSAGSNGFDPPARQD